MIVLKKAHIARKIVTFDINTCDIQKLLSQISKSRHVIVLYVKSTS